MAFKSIPILGDKLLKSDEIRRIQDGMAAKQVLKSNQTTSRYKGTYVSFYFPQRSLELVPFPSSRLRLAHVAGCRGKMAVTELGF